MAEIILAVDESYDATSCGGEGTCSGDSYQCLTHDLWTELSEEIRDFLNGILLSEIRSRDDVLGVVVRQDSQQEKALNRVVVE